GLDAWRAPVVGAGGAGHLVGPDDLAVGEVDVLQVGEVGHVRILAVGHARLHVDDHRVLQLDGEVVLLGAGGRGAVPLQAALVQALAGGQGVEEQRRGLVEHLGDHQRLVHALAGGLAGLRVAGNDHLVAEGLDQDLVLMTLLEDVADRVLGEGAGGDQALLAAFDGEVGGGWHGYAPCRWDGIAGSIRIRKRASNNECLGISDLRISIGRIVRPVTQSCATSRAAPGEFLRRRWRGPACAGPDRDKPGCHKSQPRAASSAWLRSARMSSMCSMPMDRRTRSRDTPARASSSSLSWRWVVEAGWQASDLASPMLT